MLNIFNPSRVFRDSFPSSWCDNVKVVDGTAHIPILRTEEPPSLSLEAKEGVEYFIGVLPIVRSWKETSLNNYRKMKFHIAVMGTDLPSVGIALVAKSADGEEVDSNIIELENYGLMEDCEQEFTIALNEFCGASKFDLSRIKMMKFIGYGCFTIRLSQIRIE